MLTQEQIQNLKPGDPLIIPGTFRRVDKDGAIWADIDGDYFYFSPSYVSLPSEHGTSVPTPKHDPTRLFKKGDKVRVVEWNGRKDFRNGMLAIVKSGEHGCLVEVEFILNGSNVSFIYPACCLELVTPVEELEPYKLIDSPNTYNIVRDSAMVMTIHKKSHPNAKAAAEAERDRLNAEWRKEHAND